MLQRFLWNISILIISVCFLSLSVLEFMDRNIFYPKEKEEKFLSETYILYNEIQKIIQENISNTFETTATILQNSNSNASIQQVIKKSHALISYVTVKDRLSNRVTFTNQIEDDNISYPCINSFYYVPEEKSFLICDLTPKHKIYFGLSSERLLYIINKHLKETYPSKILPQIKEIFLDGKNIYINIPNSSLGKYKTFIQESDELLNTERDFKMLWNGNRIFMEKISISSIKNNKVYHLYYDPLTRERLLDIKDMITILLFFILGLIILVLGLRFKSARKAKIIDTFSLDKHLSIQEENNQVNSLLDQLTVTLPKLNMAKPRDLPELRSIITEVIEQEKNLEGSTNSNFNSDPSPSSHIMSEEDSDINSLLQEYTDISYSIRCKQKDQTMYLHAVNRTSRSIDYQIPVSEFYIPRLLEGQEKKNYYVYKEAGKTTPVRTLLKPSYINPLLIEGVLFIELSSDPYDYIIHLFYDEIDHELFYEIFNSTINRKNSSLIN